MGNKQSLIMKRVIFYILSFTWGIIMSFIGLIVMIIPFGHYHTYHGRLYKTVSKGWGGVSLGCFFLCGEDCQYEELMCHECGHGLQNIIWGPLFPFVIAIPSAIRYWYYEIQTKKGKTFSDDWYDSAWFEGQATRWGIEYIISNKW